ncbi:MAG: extracellular solute-binding protein, partial [Chloroflexota bacterium]
GKLVLYGGQGEGPKRLAETFEKTFGLTVERTDAVSGSIFAPKVLKERQAGVYTFDVAHMPTTTALTVMRPEGVWEPMKGVFFRPDVLDDKNWNGGFASGWLDKDKLLCYTPTLDASYSLFMNSDMVKDGEIKTIKDLADPKWKGKIMWTDVRVGHTFWPFTTVRLAHGDAILKTLLVDQEPAFSRDFRQIAELMMRGRYAVTSGASRGFIKDQQNQGLAKNIKLLDIPDASYQSGLAGSTFLFNKAPHPNAAKLYMNWLLTKEGQAVFAKNIEANSRRVDVEPGDKELVPIAGRKYLIMDQEEMIPEIEKTQKIINDLVGIKN